MTWYSTIVSIGPILQEAMKVHMTFLEVLSYALTVKGEGAMVFMFKPMVRAVVKGQTFNVDPLSISTMGTLAPMHSMVICKCLVWVAHLGRESSLERQGEDVLVVLWWCLLLLHMSSWLEAYSLPSPIAHC